MAYTLELDRIRKTFDEFVAVDDLSFQIREGEIFGLLGPNGAGKTSSIRMMIGITAAGLGRDSHLWPALQPAVVWSAWATCRRSAASTRK